ncbi:hypothetical protein, partial [Alkalicoccobacillus porphyridii]|uniref:hypothetical protein n=1 Tax=Alkalicoccobacillus porphyridii TaxID=2597270 RepID=UPI001C8F67F7
FTHIKTPQTLDLSSNFWGAPPFRAFSIHWAGMVMDWLCLPTYACEFRSSSDVVSALCDVLGFLPMDFTFLPMDLPLIPDILVTRGTLFISHLIKLSFIFKVIHLFSGLNEKVQ